MSYLLDTNVWIANLRRHPRVIARLNEVDIDALPISAVVLGELRVGSRKRQNLRQQLAIERYARALQVLPVNDAVSDVYADIRARLEWEGQPIGANDLWIAAQALAFDLPLVTANTREFSRVKDLSLENWEV